MTKASLSCLPRNVDPRAATAASVVSSAMLSLVCRASYWKAETQPPTLLAHGLEEEPERRALLLNLTLLCSFLGSHHPASSLIQACV